MFKTSFLTFGLLIGSQAVDPCEKKLAESSCSTLTVTCPERYVKTPAFISIEDDSECTDMSTAYINRQCCGNTCSSSNEVQVLQVAGADQMVNAVCSEQEPETLTQSLVDYKAGLSAVQATTIAEYVDGWKFNTGTDGVHDIGKPVHENLMLFNPEWTNTDMTYIGGQGHNLELTYGDLTTVRFRMCDVVATTTPSDIVVNIYTSGTGNSWYDKRVDFTANGLHELGDGCLDMVVPVSEEDHLHPNTMNKGGDTVELSARVQAVALHVNTAALSPVSFRLESMQLNEYLVTFGE